MALTGRARPLYDHAMKAAKLALLAMAAVLVYVLLVPRLAYRHGRPTRFGRALNDAWASVFGSRLAPGHVLSLEVPGRRSGRMHRTALVAVFYQGHRYLVSMLGEQSAWVRNVRAARGEAVVHHGARLPVRLVEVPPEERAPVIKAYLRIAPGARRHIPVPYSASVDAFKPVAARCPVFRIERPMQAVLPIEAHAAG